MTQYCFLNGDIIPLSEAKVSVLDIGLVRGYGIYDGLAVINGKTLHFSDHWERFAKGANALNLKIPLTKKVLEEKIIEVVEKSGLSERANVRVILTGGDVIDGIEFDFDKPTLYVFADKWSPLPSFYFEKGASLVTYDYQREMSDIKTINYINAVKLQNFRKEKQALEILYIYNDHVLECATSNIFLVKNRTLITPAENVLRGVTSKIVLELMEGVYPVEKRKVSKGELDSADEVFITSSFKDIVPISKINDSLVGDGAVGTVTKDVMDKFSKHLQESC